MRRAELLSLTGIRFYAALAVFLYHAPQAVPGMTRFSDGKLLFNGGDAGVSFFFVLSGFILTYNYADLFRDGISASSYKRFVWDRLTKIYPVHVLTLVMALPIAILSPHAPLDWRAVPVHLALLQCFWPSATVVVGFRWRWPRATRWGSECSCGTVNPTPFACTSSPDSPRPGLWSSWLVFSRPGYF